MRCDSGRRIAWLEKERAAGPGDDGPVAADPGPHEGGGAATAVSGRGAHYTQRKLEKPYSLCSGARLIKVSHVGRRG